MAPQARPAARATSGDVLLAGASGLVGQALARQWTGPGTLHLLVRRAVTPPPGCRVVRVDWSAPPALPAAERAICALGTTIKVAGSQAAFRAVDHDVVMAFARSSHAAGVTRFAVVSSLGADPRSRSFYSRVKGETELALRGIGFESLVIARPSLLDGARETLGQPPRMAERLALAIARPLSPLMPWAWRPIHADVLARALLRSLEAPAPGVTVLDSAALQRLGR